MALLAEEIVEEWLNRQGYFTIRGIKVGVHEIDLLAVRLRDGQVNCRHFEVQASVRPVSYLTKVPKDIQRRTGRAAGSAKARSAEELEAAVTEWVDKKYRMQKKARVRESLAPGPWTCELVVHRLRHLEEADVIAQHGVLVHRLTDIVDELRREDLPVQRAAGADFVDLLIHAVEN
jgi:hypothetical protein